MVEVFSKPNCAPCAGTKRFLQENNIQFTEYDVTQDADKFNEIIDMGYNSVPVVRTAKGSFAGLNLAELRKLV